MNSQVDPQMPHRMSQTMRAFMSYAVKKSGKLETKGGLYLPPL